jgi:hypothetical protein
MIESLQTIDMYLMLFNRGMNNTHSQTNSRYITTLVSGFLPVKRCAAPITLRDQGSIVPTLYIYVSHTEALLMTSNTSYHKCLPIIFLHYSPPVNV